MTRTDEGAASGSGSTLRDYLDVLRRRKWVVAIAVVATPLAALAFSLSQSELYRSSADVLLVHQDLGATLTNTSDPSAYLQPDRLAQTEADLAREDAVAQAVVAAAGPSMRDAGVTPWSAEQFLDASDADVKPNSNLLELSVVAPDASLATRLATLYAFEFASYRHRIDSASYERAAAQLESAIKPLAKARRQRSALYRSLVEKLLQVQTLEALQTPSHVVRSESEAVQIQPEPKRALLLGLLLGCVVGIGLAFAWEALDTRVRSADEIRQRLGLPVLARVSRPRRGAGSLGSLVTVAEPSSGYAEAYRLLRANLDFVNRDVGAKTIMFTSAVQGEGKSTIVANLAVVLSRIGRRVVLVDLDLRRPTLHRFFDLDSPLGLTSVALGEVDLATALSSVTISGNGVPDRRPTADVGLTWTEVEREAPTAKLEVLSAGGLGYSGEIVGAPVLLQILEDLTFRADVVLIDAPPLLESSAAVTLSGEVDAIVLVTQLETTKRRYLSELRNVLDTSTATALGVVVNGTWTASDYPIYGPRSTFDAGVFLPGRFRELVGMHNGHGGAPAPEPEVRAEAKRTPTRSSS